MDRVRDLEDDRKSRSSVDSPLDGEDSWDTTNTEARRKLTGKFMLCHYFDYIAGTSVGGYV